MRSSTTSSARRSSTCPASRRSTATSRTGRSGADVTDGPQVDTRTGRPHPLLRGCVDAYSGYDMRGFPPGRHVGMPSRHLTFIVQFDAPLELAVFPGGRAAPQCFEALVSG